MIELTRTNSNNEPSDDHHVISNVLASILEGIEGRVHNVPPDEENDSCDACASEIKYQNKFLLVIATTLNVTYTLSTLGALVILNLYYNL